MLSIDRGMRGFFARGVSGPIGLRYEDGASTWFSEDCVDAGKPGDVRVRQHDQGDRQGAESLHILPEGQRLFVC